jgi:hypothetical protein
MLPPGLLNRIIIDAWFSPILSDCTRCRLYEERAVFVFVRPPLGVFVDFLCYQATANKIRARSYRNIFVPLIHLNREEFPICHFHGKILPKCAQRLYAPGVQSLVPRHTSVCRSSRTPVRRFKGTRRSPGKFQNVSRFESVHVVYTSFPSFCGSGTHVAGVRLSCALQTWKKQGSAYETW